MNETEITKNVQQRYAAIAREGTSCCTSSASSCCSADAGSTLLSLSTEPALIAQADLGLSCGLPTQSAGIQHGETVLDLGSGSGVDVFRAAQAVGPNGRVIGVDMTPEMIARAQALAQQNGVSNVEFRLGHIEDLPVEDSSVDLVISNCVINLAPDKAAVYREIYRVLKPAGRFTISDMVSWGQVPEDIRKDPELWCACLGGAIEEQAYLDTVREAGFSSVGVLTRVSSPAEDGAAYGFTSLTIQGFKA